MVLPEEERGRLSLLERMNSKPCIGKSFSVAALSIAGSQVYETVGRHTNVSGILSDAQAARFLIQDFRPLAQSVEWQLGQAYLDRGSQAFAGDRHIPFAVNNDGNLSVDAAEVLFHKLQDAEDQRTLESEIRVLELGPGLGLFARYFLDAFRELCLSEKKTTTTD